MIYPFRKDLKIEYAYKLSDVLKYGLNELGYTANYPKADTTAFTRNLFTYYGINFPANTLIPQKYLDNDRMVHSDYVYAKNVPDFLQYPTMNYEKFSLLTNKKKKYEIKYQSQVDRITGIFMNINESPFAIVDFDINKSYDETKKQQVRDEIIKQYNLEYGLVKTTSGGLHYYTLLDKVPEWYLSKNGRHVGAYECEDYAIDLFIPFGKEVPLNLTLKYGINEVVFKAEDINFVLENDSQAPKWH